MNTTAVELAFGHRAFTVEIPTASLLGVIHPKSQPVVADEETLVAQAMAQPIGTRPLRHLARPGQKVAIVTSDLTRPCPSDKLLPFILDELSSAGVPDEDIFIILGLGLHRPMSEEEISLAVTPQIQGRIRVVNHDVHDTLFLGTTSFGTPVEIFRPLVEADVRIALGVIEFHYFAGYSGGAKAIFPGCASRRSVTANHAMMLRPGAEAARIDGNPVRMDLEEAVAMLGVDFILNVVVDGNHRIVGAFAGDLTAAHRKGCEFVAARGKVLIPKKADIVLASAGGYPKDINFYQAQKAMHNANYSVRDGGVIILVAACMEGFGNKTFEEWMLGTASPRDLIERIQKGFVLGGHKAAAVAAMLQRASIYMVSELPAEQVQRSGMVYFDHPQKALEAAFEQLGRESQVLVLPQAGSILPQIG